MRKNSDINWLTWFNEPSKEMEVALEEETVVKVKDA